MGVDDTSNITEHVGIAEYISEHTTGHNTCELCGHALDNIDGKSHHEVQTEHKCLDRMETLHWLWHLSKQHPDRAYILLARLIGGLTITQISKNMSGRPEAPTGATISMIASSMTDDICEQVGDEAQVKQMMKRILGNGKLKIHTNQGNKKKQKTELQNLCSRSLWDTL